MVLSALNRQWVLLKEGTQEDSNFQLAVDSLLALMKQVAELQRST